MYHNPTKEILIDVINWYNTVNTSGMVTIDDLARLKPMVERARLALDLGDEQAQYWLLDFEGDKDQFDDID